MAAGTWQPLVGGRIMIWEPMVVSKLDDTQHLLSQLAVSEADIQDQLNSSYDDDEHTSILPSVKTAASTSFSTEKCEPTLSTSTMSTLSVRSKDNIVFSDNLNETPPSSPPFKRPWYEQLEEFSTLPEEETVSTVNDLTPIKSSSLAVSSDGGYVSDSTDFLLESPCPGVLARQPLQAIDNLQTIAKRKRDKNPNAVARRLDFGSRIGPLKIKRMRAPEYSVRHGWTSSERLLLCTLNRWYRRDYTTFARVFNEVFSLDLSKAKLNTQFVNYERVNGGSVSSEYNDVFFATPFADTEGRYTEYRDHIERTASALGIKIRRLEIETQSPSGKALMRKYRKELTRRTPKVAAAAPTQVESLLRHPVHTGGFSLAADEIEEILTDVEDAPPTQSAQKSSFKSQPPCLLFRVWDASSRTDFGPDGFVSSAFKEWSELPPPIPPNDPYHAFKLLAHLHLSRTGDTPCFIAAAESLIQVLTIAASLDKPQIAVIDLGAPSMQEEHKTHLASKTFKWLKTDGKINIRYQYQGHGDYFTHATIANEAILKHFKLEDLDDLCNHDEAAARLMNLKAFKPGLRTPEVASAIRDNPTLLNTRVAATLGRLANLFLGNTRASLQHITALIARLVDGWAIEKNDATDMHSLSSMAAAFASNFGSHSGCSRQDLMGAFQDGVEDGIQSVARWSRSSSRRRKCRKR